MQTGGRNGHRPWSAGQLSFASSSGHSTPHNVRLYTSSYKFYTKEKINLVLSGEPAILSKSF
jgi:hypothetical protein